MFYFSQNVEQQANQYIQPNDNYHNFNIQSSTMPYNAYAQSPYNTNYARFNGYQYDNSFSSGYSSANTSANSPLFNQYNNSSPIIANRHENYPFTSNFTPQNRKDISPPSTASSISYQIDDIIQSSIAPCNEETSLIDTSIISDDLNESESCSKKKRVLTSTQRIAANKRERKRMCIMNDAFVDLRHKLPISTGRKRRKMSRLDIVIGAIEYIAYLDSILSNKTDEFNTSFNFNFDNQFS